MAPPWGASSPAASSSLVSPVEQKCLLNASACLLNWTFFGSSCSLPGARTLPHHSLILLLLSLY